MARRVLHRHVEISDYERTVAAAEVTSQGPGGTAWVSLGRVRAHHPGVPRGPGRCRAGPARSARNTPLKVVFPLGDYETLLRLQERCLDVRTHPAGASAIMEANPRPVTLLTGQVTEKTDHAERHLTLRQTAGKQSLTRHCPVRLNISPRRACMYGVVTTDMLLQTPAAQEPLAWR